MNIKDYFNRVSQKMDALTDEEFLTLLEKVGLNDCPVDPTIYYVKSSYNTDLLNNLNISNEEETFEISSYITQKSITYYNGKIEEDNLFTFCEVA